MPIQFNPQLVKTLRDTLETLAIAVAGGAIFGLSGFPGGYLSGAIIAVAIAALAGRPMGVPMPLTRVIFVFIGISLGSVVTPETLTGMATYPASIAVLIVAMIAVSYIAAQYLRVVHGWDSASAYLGAAPGGMSQVLAIAADVGADVRAIAIVQAMRVVIVAVGLPAVLGLAGLTGTAMPRAGSPLSASVVDELAILVAASTAMAIVAYKMRFPGGLMFGAMLTSAILHGTGWIHAVMPWWAALAAMMSLGAVTGSRFAGTPPALLLKFVAAAFGTFAVATVVTALFAAGLLVMVKLKAAEVMIAFAPGSVDAMMLLALALHLDPVYVGAHHLTRIFLVSLSMPLVARRVSHGSAGEPPAPADTPPAKDSRPFGD